MFTFYIISPRTPTHINGLLIITKKKKLSSDDEKMNSYTRTRKRYQTLKAFVTSVALSSKIFNFSFFQTTATPLEIELSIIVININLFTILYRAKQNQPKFRRPQFEKQTINREQEDNWKRTQFSCASCASFHGNIFCQTKNFPS